MKNLTAKDIMNCNIVSVNEEMSVAELACFLTEKELSGAPVTNKEGKLVGVVSLFDIAKSGIEEEVIEIEAPNPDFYVHGWEDKLDSSEIQRLHIEHGGKLVRDIMTPVVFTVTHDTPIPKIAKTMLAGRIHRLFVTEKNQVTGIVTTIDMLKIHCMENYAGKDVDRIHAE